MASLTGIRKELKPQANPERAAHSQRYFKAGPGEYAEGDKFLGIRVPEIRKIASRFKALNIVDISALLQSKLHEERLLALIMLVNRFKKGDEAEQEYIYKLYLKNTAFINNWDLVDSSAPAIIGGWLNIRQRDKLYELAHSDSLWQRRIAVLATFTFIKQGDFSDSLKLAVLLLQDKEDLIHKATGWMLREIGNIDRTTELAFLDKYAHRMPRTMLRYAIEKFTPTLRKKYLTQKP